jgi:peptidoglycan/xylan/chitin deacetylase (PgdA/CDA1 family)
VVAPLKSLRERVPVPAALSLAALKMLRWSGRRAGVVVVYHRVDDPPGDRRFELVPALGTALFEAEVRHLGRHYALVAASELPARVRARRRGERFPAAITFDDDLRSHATTAAPILRRAGAPAAFFLCGASLDAPASFWWQDLQSAAGRGAVAPALAATAVEALAREAPEREPYGLRRLAGAIQRLAPAERAEIAAHLRAAAGAPPAQSVMPARDVDRLARDDFEIGFHTLGHEPLTTLPDGELARALSEGRDALAAAAGTPLTMISYPHGDADARVADAARQAGFALGFAAGNRAVRGDDDPLLLSRVGASQRRLGHFALALVLALLRRR